MLGPKLDFVYWQALFAPGRTPEPVIKTLKRRCKRPFPIRRIVKIGPRRMCPSFHRINVRQRQQAQFTSEITRWGQVIRDNNIHLD